MAMLWAESFDYYTGLSSLLEGVWAEANSNAFSLLTSGARTGSNCIRMNQTGGELRRTLGGPRNELFVAFAIFPEELPQADNTIALVAFRDQSNLALGELRLQSDGSLQAFGTALAPLGRTTTPVIPPNAWSHVEVRYVSGAGSGAFEVRVNEAAVLTLNSLSLTAGVAQIALRPITGLGFRAVRFDDFVVCDNSGTVNNTWRGDLRVATLQLNGDINSTWSRNSRRIVSDGVASAPPAGASGFYTPSVGLGAGDFTMETWVRFSSFPTLGNRAVIAGDWRELTNQRAWELALGGPDFASGNLVWRVSTNGQAGTISTLHSVAAGFELNRWYHIAVVRNAGINTLYINGRVRSVRADSFSYPAGSRFSICGGGDSVGGLAATPTDAFNGFLDDLRLTRDVRYTAEFIPPTARHARGAADPNWTNVLLLLGFEGNSLADESSAARAYAQGFTTALAFTPLTAITPDDGIANFQSVSQLLTRDDTWVEAPFLAARGVLTLTGLPLNTETVRLGATTYRFVNALALPNDVLIGATPDASLANLNAAVNAGAGGGTVYHASTTQNASVFTSPLPGQNQLEAYARTAGAAGNAIVSTETLTNGSFTAAVLQGGADIPAAQDFAISSLPFDATGVRAAILVNRMRKSDAGPAEIRASIVTAAGGVANAASRTLTTAFTYYNDVVELDPNTSAALTPQSLLGARFRLNRTI